MPVIFCYLFKYERGILFLLEKQCFIFEDAVTLRCHVVVSQRFPKSRAIKQDYQMILMVVFTDGLTFTRMKVLLDS